MKKLLNEIEALEYLNRRGLNISLPQLRRYRRKKVSPMFLKNTATGEVAYPMNSLDFFAEKVWQPGFSQKEI